jgi:hypothetical protein
MIKPIPTFHIVFDARHIFHVAQVGIPDDGDHRFRAIVIAVPC